MTAFTRLALSSLPMAPNPEPLNDETIETSVTSSTTAVVADGGEPTTLKELQNSLATPHFSSLVTFAEPSFCLASVYEYLTTPEVASAYFK